MGWISVYAIIEKYPKMKADMVYSLAESRLRMFSDEFEVPEYEAPCECYWLSPNKKEYQKDCEYCLGKGIRKTNVNPLSRYSFYELGDDALYMDMEESMQDFRTLMSNGKPTDILTTGQLLSLRTVPNGIITPEKHYFDCDIYRDSEDWTKQFRELCKKYSNHYVVPASCHC
ncbi:hypothetical protein [Thermoactinomyces sp. DSM 45892]|uniref:hypothetical protein n=1 Tax=Thermoactinomyces sp. DSM 45892 TaxID=1882753 RepID=UPI00089CFCC8|nr:hypothetical protein [Thermoactinomyces sp. DSM 45892]SDY87056.1 hypothetical protein SAMN05444416_109126 [Thermoactinomyces sp. DSM 45892]